MKKVFLSGVGFLDKPCERCNDGKSLHCSEPCKKYKDTGHSHECPDCERLFDIEAEQEDEK